MKIKAAEAIINLINVSYGMQKFVDNGGGIVYLPSPIDKIYMAGCSMLDEETQERIKQIDNEVEFVKEYNLSSDELDDKVLKYFKDKFPGSFIAFNFNPIVNAITITGLRPEDSEAKEIERMLRSLKGHKRTYLLFADSKEKMYKLVEGYDKDVEGYEEIKIARPSSKRETVITSDDILNLKIAIETATSLESFLEMV